nr:hypothetical protein [Tanacetum cinerariifolium]
MFIEELENMIKYEPHFITKIIDNDLCALTMITKHFVSEHRTWIVGTQLCKLWWHRGGLVILRGKSLRDSKNGCREVGGVEKISSTGSKFMVNEENCIDGCDGANGGEVKGDGVDFGVLKSSPGEIPNEIMGERD